MVILFNVLISISDQKFIKNIRKITMMWVWKVTEKILNVVYLQILIVPE